MLGYCAKLDPKQQNVMLLAKSPCVANGRCLESPDNSGMSLFTTINIFYFIAVVSIVITCFTSCPAVQIFQINILFWGNSDITLPRQIKEETLEYGSPNIYCLLERYICQPKLYPGLQAKRSDQQGQGGDSAPLLCPGESPAAMLHPALGSQHRKDMDLLERVQRRGTSMIREMESLSCEDRLRDLEVQSRKKKPSGTPHLSLAVP
ncbi:hypothetical protein DUI87_16371 [Hirundo rustica rustica]|uniref:Uncharacterized protein n=1 Tax=Hirundo rustica rustica TaxID=333673 RepID=A0A3M0K791_HIRRU|nr:hypothetical protein DUI87_16371 [Hirundo rustica rustica]